MKFTLKILCLASAAVIAASCGTIGCSLRPGSSGNSGVSAEVNVMPDLTGLLPEEASERYPFISIVDSGNIASDKVEKGRIAMQDIHPGTEILYGQQVSVCLSVGNDPDDLNYTMLMPDLRGLDINTAEAQYGDYIHFQIEYTDSIGVEKNTILNQAIAPGTEFRQGTAMKITVSQGEDPNDEGDMVMPDFTGRYFNDMVREYKNLIKFEVGGYVKSELTYGSIANQTIDPGSHYKRGVTMTVYLSNGEPPETTTAPPTTQPQTTTSAGEGEEYEYEYEYDYDQDYDYEDYWGEDYEW